MEKWNIYVGYQIRTLHEIVDVCQNEYKVYTWKRDVTFGPMQMQTGWQSVFSYKWKLLSHVRLLVTPWTIQSMGFSRPERVAFPLSRWSSQPRDSTQVSHIAGGFFTSWAIRVYVLFFLMFTRVYVFSPCCCSVAKSCPTLCDPIDHSMPGFPILHYLLEFLKTRVHSVGGTNQPSHLLSPSSPPALNFSQHQGLFQRVGSSHQVANVLEFQLQHQSFQWLFRVDFL